MTLLSVRDFGSLIGTPVYFQTVETYPFPSNTAMKRAVKMRSRGEHWIGRVIAGDNNHIVIDRGMILNGDSEMQVIQFDIDRPWAIRRDQLSHLSRI